MENAICIKNLIMAQIALWCKKGKFYKKEAILYEKQLILREELRFFVKNEHFSIKLFENA